MKKTSNIYLIYAIFLGIVFHGSAIFFTLETTYDALIHLFFADHYANNWFEPWNFKWYTGFTVMSYPPLVHQTIAALSLIGGLKFGLFSVAIISIILFITGVYRFSLLITSNKKIAGYSALIAVFSSSFTETLHVFGQLPSIVGIAILMHALPEIYLWLKTGKYRYLFTALSLIAVTVTSHHVTPIFGMVFFIFPLIGMVVLDISKEKTTSFKNVSFKIFLKTLLKILNRIICFGGASIIIIIGCILPYWINSKNNPITQIPIPHGSRDNFIEVGASGLVFFIIPWGILLFILPYLFYRFWSKRYLFFGISFTLLSILGTGGTTCIPKTILGENAFNILTLDRFTLWASIMSLPIFGEFIFRFIEGDLKKLIQKKFGFAYHRFLGVILASIFIFMTIFTMSLGYFKPLQPQKINMLPIINFLNQDQHDKWRYLTLGFGDQIAWLSAQTKAMTVDGNYHSARRLPELTTRPIERLENAKFKGVAGIGSLQQFLTTPEKYNLKYIFSNDKFYDPILYFCGWQRLPQLENGIMVWEKLSVPPLSSILPKKEVATWQKLAWGIIPFITMIIAFILNIQSLLKRNLKTRTKTALIYLKNKRNYLYFSTPLFKIGHLWAFILVFILSYNLYALYLKNDSQRTPKNVISAYYDALDFKNFEKSHQLIDPKSNVSISQFMLEIAVTDGLLNSYSKLESLESRVIKQTDSLAKVEVHTSWITPLEKINKTVYKTIVNRNGKWFLQREEVIDPDLPPDQLYTNNTVNYFNHGRRKITTQQTYHEDILRLVDVEIISAKLIKYNNRYAIVGEIQNIDNVPGDIVLKGTLYNDTNKELATYNAKYHVKHKLLPKEVSSFRIDFEGIAWSKTRDSIPTSFNPDEFTPIELKELPTKFNLQITGNVSSSDLYKNVVLSDLNIAPKAIKGTLFNSGLQEVTVPQLLITYYNKHKKIIWVDHLFLEKGIKQQRKQYFKYHFVKNLDSITVLSDNMDFCYVNGMPNTMIARKTIPNRIEGHSNIVLQKIPHSFYDFIKIEMNNYIGNPK